METRLHPPVVPTASYMVRAALRRIESVIEMWYNYAHATEQLFVLPGQGAHETSNGSATGATEGFRRSLGTPQPLLTRDVPTGGDNPRGGIVLPGEPGRRPSGRSGPSARPTRHHNLAFRSDSGCLFGC